MLSSCRTRYKQKFHANGQLSQMRCSSERVRASIQALLSISFDLPLVVEKVDILLWFFNYRLHLKAAYGCNLMLRFQCPHVEQPDDTPIYNVDLGIYISTHTDAHRFECVRKFQCLSHDIGDNEKYAKKGIFHLMRQFRTADRLSIVDAESRLWQSARTTWQEEIPRAKTVNTYGISMNK